jgi:hypothetical protein
MTTKLFIGNCDIYYMSRWYCNKSKSQLTSPTPAQAASCCIISGTYSILSIEMTFTKLLIDNLDKYLIAWDTECPFRCHTATDVGAKSFFKWNCPQSYIYLKWQLTFVPASEVAGQEDIPYHFKKGMVCQYGMVCPPATSKAGNSVVTFSTNFDCNFTISWRIRKYRNWLQNRYRKCLQNVTLIYEKSSTSRMWNVVGAEQTSTSPNRIVI